jgi:hypothetical protein
VRWLLEIVAPASGSVAVVLYDAHPWAALWCVAVIVAAVVWAARSERGTP